MLNRQMKPETLRQPYNAVAEGPFPRYEMQENACHAMA